MRLAVINGALRGAATLPQVVAVLVAATGAGCGAGGGAPSRPAARAGDRPVLHGARTVAGRFAGIPQRGSGLGDPHAPFTLVVFADLQCPFCAAFDRDILPTVIDRYVRPGRLRIELRVIAFLGPDSATAASAAASAQLQSHLWEFADLVYRNQGRENSGYVTPAYLGAIAAAVPGLDRRRFLAASGTPELRRVLEADARSARTAGVTATPTLRMGRTGGVLTAPVSGPVRRDELLHALAKLVG